MKSLYYYETDAAQIVAKNALIFEMQYTYQKFNTVRGDASNHNQLDVAQICILSVNTQAIRIMFHSKEIQERK